MSQSHNINLLGLDFGDSKIGVARAGSIAKMPEPLDVIANDEFLVKKLKKLLAELDISVIVVGIPRNLSGEETEQSSKIRQQIESIKNQLNEVEFVFVDESLSSVRANEYLKSSKSQASEDSIAACYILEEYFTINK